MEIYIIEKRLRADAYSENHTWYPSPHGPVFGTDAKKVAEAHCTIAESEYPSYQYRAMRVVYAA